MTLPLPQGTFTILSPYDQSSNFLACCHAFGTVLLLLGKALKKSFPQACLWPYISTTVIFLCCLFLYFIFVCWCFLWSVSIAKETYYLQAPTMSVCSGTGSVEETSTGLGMYNKWHFLFLLFPTGQIQQTRAAGHGTGFQLLSTRSEFSVASQCLINLFHVKLWQQWLYVECWWLSYFPPVLPSGNSHSQKIRHWPQTPWCPGGEHLGVTLPFWWVGCGLKVSVAGTTLSGQWPRDQGRFASLLVLHCITNSPNLQRPQATVELDLGEANQEGATEFSTNW